MSEAVFCARCGGACRMEGQLPVCPVDGPQWEFVRNAPCSAVIITRDDGEVLLGRRAEEPWGGCWELPGGFTDLGEHPATTAVREVREELGLEVRLDSLFGIYLHPSPYPGDRTWRQVTVFVARVIGDPAAEPDLDCSEVSDWGWFDPASPPTPMVSHHRDRLDEWVCGAEPLDVGDARPVTSDDPA